MKGPEQLIISSVYSLLQQFFFFLANNALDQGSFEEIKKNETRLVKTKPFMT